MNNFRKLNVFISSIMGGEYKEIRKKLSNCLNHPLFYPFEFSDGPGSSMPLPNSYMTRVDNCDVLVTLIDNKYGIREGTMNEIRRAIELNKKIIFVILRFEKDNPEFEESLQEFNIKSRNVANVSSFDEMADKALDSLLDDISQGYLSYLSPYPQDNKNIKLVYGGGVNKDDLKGADSICKFLVSLEPPFSLAEIDKDDETLVGLLKIIIGLGKFDRDTFKALKEKVLAGHKDNLKDVISKRFDAFGAYLTGDDDSAIVFLKEALSLFDEKLTKSYKWLNNDIILDIRNIALCNWLSPNMLEEGNKAQELLNQSDEKLSFPYFDRCNYFLYKKFNETEFKDATKQLSSIQFAGKNNSDEYLLLAEAFLSALKYGSITLVNSFKTAYFDYRWTQYKNKKHSYHFLEMIRLCVIDRDYTKINKVLRIWKYDETFNLNNHIKQLVGSIDLLPAKNQEESATLLLATVGYLINDKEFEDLFLKLASYAYKFASNSKDVSLNSFKYIFKAYANNINRIGERVWAFVDRLKNKKDNTYVSSNIHLIFDAVLYSKHFDKMTDNLVDAIITFKTKDNENSLANTTVSIIYKQNKYKDKLLEAFKKHTLLCELVNFHFEESISKERFDSIESEIRNSIIVKRHGITFGNLSSLDLLYDVLCVFRSKQMEQYVIDGSLQLMIDIVSSPYPIIGEKMVAVQSLICLDKYLIDNKKIASFLRNVSDNYMNYLQLSSDFMFEQYNTGHLFFALCFLVSWFDRNEESRLKEMFASITQDEESCYKICSFINSAIPNYSEIPFTDSTKSVLLQFLWHCYNGNNNQLRNIAFVILRNLINDKDLTETIQKGFIESFYSRDHGEKIGIIRSINKLGTEYNKRVLMNNATVCGDFEVSAFIKIDK